MNYASNTNVRPAAPVDQAGNIRGVESHVANGSAAQTLPTLPAEKFSRYFLLALVLAVGVAFLYMIKLFLVPVILAAVFAGLFYSLYRWLLKMTRSRRGLSALLCCLILSLGVLGPAYAVANMVAKEAIRGYQTAEARMHNVVGDGLRSRIAGHPIIQRLQLNKLPVQAWVDQFGKKATELLAAAINQASRQTFELISTILITFFTMFYFFRDGPMLLQRLKALSPLAEPYEEELIRRFVTTSGATVKGVLFVSMIKGTLGGLTFWAFGIEAPVLWGVVMTFLSILPIIGPWVVMVPAAIIMMLNGSIWAGMLLLLAALAIGSIDNLLEPFLIGRDSGMHELLVFFSMIGGIAVFGVTGFIIGPVIAALFRTLLDIYSIEFSKQLHLLHDLPAVRNPRSSIPESQSHAMHTLAIHSRP